VNQDLYSTFIPYILSDVAERRTDSGAYLPRGHRRWMQINGERRRVFVHGDHICYQNEEFHNSDAEHRLSMAVAAAEIVEQARLDRSWGSNTKASLYVAQALLQSGCKRLKGRFLRSDPRVDGAPGTAAEPAVLRLAETIRRQVRRYQARHPHWRRDFNLQVASFRGSLFRDPEWFREVEERHVRWLAEFEKRREFDWNDAMRIVPMARLYQELHKFDESAALHRKAIVFARKAIMNEKLRRVVLLWLRASVKACIHNVGPVRDPAYVGPRLSNQ
jgi:hypothetical protein